MDHDWNCIYHSSHYNNHSFQFIHLKREMDSKEKSDKTFKLDTTNRKEHIPMNIS